MPGVPDELKLRRAAIDAHLEAYLHQLPLNLGIAVSADGKRALQMLDEFALRPGKRLRGALSMVSYEMFGGTKYRHALDLAVAMELAQDYLLIVDDIMDRSDTRRGRATVHRQYRDMLEHAGKSGGTEHAGNMLGLSVGLIAQHLSARLLNEIDTDPARLVRVQQLFQTNIAATAFGQMDDLMNQASEHFTIEQIRRMYVLKSGYYTFVNPLQLGAVLAGVGDEELGPLRAFGEHAGLAFQLQDDLLGMFGDEAATGKSSMDDLREGKMTLLMRHALTHADLLQRHYLHAALGNKRVTRRQHLEVCAILTAVGSRDYVAQQARRAARAARTILSAQTAWDRQCLDGLLEYAVYRGE